MESVNLGIAANNFYFYQNKKVNPSLLKKIVLATCILLSFHYAPAQGRDSLPGCSLQVSLLTCTPGDELYSSFGHSALRLKDSVYDTDVIFNYGTFDFYDPAFYKKFIRGKLLYFVSIQTYDEFMEEYEYFKRGVTEQVIRMDCGEKNALVNALYENAKEENKNYRYDFNYDNCTTRLYEMLKKYSADSFETKNILPYKDVTFRNLIHIYLDRGGQYWSKFGIDILLGAPLDKAVTNEEAMFLPDYLMIGLDSTTVAGSPLVTGKNELLPYTGRRETKPLFTPLVVFCLLLAWIGSISFLKSKTISRFLRVFDILFFGLLGLMGAWLLFMWFGTDHAMCKNNYNLLWAFPGHLVAAFLIPRNKPFIKKYFRFNLLLVILLLLAWFFLPQQLNPALVPVVLISGIRSFFISKA